MELTLSWDLIVVLFFAVVMAYSFIVGKDEAVKIVISSYIAIVAVQAAGNLLSLVFGDGQMIASLFGLSSGMNIVSTLKLILFVATIIGLAIQGGFEMVNTKDLPSSWDIALTTAFGFTTSGLLITALLTYIAAKPILALDLAAAPLLQPILQQSSLVQIMVDYQNVWFFLPAALLLTIGFLNRKTE